MFTRKQKLYTSFVDFKAAYDSVWREALFYKLHKIGIDGHILHIIKSMYQNTTSCVKIQHLGTTVPFEVNLGLKQGCTLSPTLFLIFINDIVKDISCNETRFNDILMFADDITFNATTPEILQTMMDKLSVYSAKWKLTVNVQKTKYIVFCKSGKFDETNTIYYNGKKIENVKEFEYLGVIFTISNKFNRAIENNRLKASKAFYALSNALETALSSLNRKVYADLIKSLVMSIFMYGSEIWGVANITENSVAERFNTWLCKRILGVSKRCPNDTVRAFTGMYPIETEVNIRMTQYFMYISKFTQAF